MAGNPFGAPAAKAPTPGGEKKVTLVIDDSAVKDSEIGRGGKVRAVVLVIVGVFVGAAVGWGVGGTTQEREQYNLALQDGKEIYASLNEASKTIEAAQGELKKALEATHSGPGKTASVDYTAVANMVALKKPFSANEFHRRRYRAFPAPVVDDLFDYYNNINLIWDKLAVLGAKTAGDNRRQALDESAQSADGLIKTNYGVVITKAGDAVAGGLVAVAIPAAEEGDKGNEREAPKVEVASSAGGRTVERTLYVGQRDLGVKYQDYVILLDKMRSRNILGQGASLFAEYRAQLMEINALMTKVVEAQGRLTKELGKIAALPEQSFL